ncbi:MAG: hypothetical protein IH886_16100 [Nitrospinae bacterium]|nr:hypothetical protein [Nitrospinota bacterium]
MTDTKPSQPWKPTLRGKGICRYGIKEKNVYLKYGDWLARNWKNKSFYETPKIAIRETGKRIIATLDLEERYFLSSLYAIYPKENVEEVSLYYLLGILNSFLSSYFVKIIAFELTKGAFTKIRTNQLARLPIRQIDNSILKERGMHDCMVRLVETMLNLNKQLDLAKTAQDKTHLQRRIDATDQEIDQLVYQLYDLTPEEIAIVEESTQ